MDSRIPSIHLVVIGKAHWIEGKDDLVRAAVSAEIYLNRAGQLAVKRIGADTDDGPFDDQVVQLPAEAADALRSALMHHAAEPRKLHFR